LNAQLGGDVRGTRTEVVTLRDRLAQHHPSPVGSCGPRAITAGTVRSDVVSLGARLCPRSEECVSMEQLNADM